MVRRHRELWYALAAIVAVTAVYQRATWRAGALPPASQLLGHGIGIVGFVLMLMTETLYTLRKQSSSARWGSMAGWLRFHMFTGMVGPYMVLLHPAAEFRGLAAVVTLLTVIVVISGLVGRYIYTAVPRTSDGLELQVSVLEHELAQAGMALAGPTAHDPGEVARAPQAATGFASSEVVLGRAWQDMWARWQDWRTTRRLDATPRRKARQRRALVRRRQALQRQLDTLASARSMLAVWRAMHVPLAMVLFVTALVHIGGAIYYATLLR